MLGCIAVAARTYGSSRSSGALGTRIWRSSSSPSSARSSGSWIPPTPRSQKMNFVVVRTGVRAFLSSSSVLRLRYLPWQRHAWEWVVLIAGNLSYSGPNGQNALHAAVLRNKVFTEKLLGWNKGLTTERDENGSTPLHFAAAVFSLRRRRVLSQVFEANPAALYLSDHDGLFPIHVAASVGARATVAMFLKEYPSSAGLRDAKRRTFLHAVREKKLNIVGFACRTTSLAWILNMQDIDGNTALHLAVKAGNLSMFCSLLANGAVHLNLTNDKGQTPLDIARYIFPQE